MNLIPTRRPVKKNIRDVVSNKRAVNKAVKESISDQKKVTLQAARLRAQEA
jgi:hypothetical protein